MSEFQDHSNNFTFTFIALSFTQIPIVLEKEQDRDDHGSPIVLPDGKQKFRCGFRIGGGIDQDNTKSPQGYPDKVGLFDLLHVFLS